MGCFSWRSCVSGKSILENKQTVIIFPDNDVLAGTYDGYGRINGIDIYVLFALKYNLKKAQKITEKNTNSYDDIRSKAINIDSTGGPNSGGCGFRIMRKSEYRKDMLYRDLPISFNCPEQGANSGRGIDKRFSGKQKYYSLQKCKDIFAKHPNENWYVEFGWNETLKYNGYIAYINSGMKKDNIFWWHFNDKKDIKMLEKYMLELKNEQMQNKYHFLTSEEYDLYIRRLV